MSACLHPQHQGPALGLQVRRSHRAAWVGGAGRQGRDEDGAAAPRGLCLPVSPLRALRQHWEQIPCPPTVAQVPQVQALVRGPGKGDVAGRSHGRSSPHGTGCGEGSGPAPRPGSPLLRRDRSWLSPSCSLQEQGRPGARGDLDGPPARAGERTSTVRTHSPVHRSLDGPTETQLLAQTVPQKPATAAGVASLWSGLDPAPSAHVTGAESRRMLTPACAGSVLQPNEQVKFQPRKGSVTFPSVVPVSSWRCESPGVRVAVGGAAAALPQRCHSDGCCSGTGHAALSAAARVSRHAATPAAAPQGPLQLGPLFPWLA